MFDKLCFDFSNRMNIKEQPYDKILDMTKLVAFTDDKINVHVPQINDNFSL